MARPFSALLTALVVFAAAASGSLGSRSASAEAEAFDGASSAIRKQIDSTRADDRLKGYDRLGKIKDARAFDLVMQGAATERARGAKIAAAQTEAQTQLEAALADIEKFNKEPSSGGADIEKFNRRSKKLEKRREDVYTKQRDLAVDAMQQKAVFGAVVAAAAGVLNLVGAAEAPPLLERLTAEWNGPKSPLDDRLRWVDVLAGVRAVPTGDILKKIALDVTADVHVRAAAISARAARVDAGAVEDSLAVLVEGQDHMPAVAAAIDALRRLHQRPAIEPLIVFLGREDVGRLRSDAHLALRSLTGEKYGPYKQPWDEWWKAVHTVFEMPSKPADILELTTPEKGLTFYGITTFSEHLLFVLDVSGSMLDLAHPDAASARKEERKIDLLRKEFAATLAMLEDGKTFDVVFFSHRVFRLLGVISPATKPIVERARKFALELEPTGGTNIHDALETAFRIAGAATATTTGKDVSAVDTIFFMTDGTPTAGKEKDADRILEIVREWNRTARITIHVIGMGDECDFKFLQSLAVQNGGQFVKRFKECREDAAFLLFRGGEGATRRRGRSDFPEVALAAATNDRRRCPAMGSPAEAAA